MPFRRHEGLGVARGSRLMQGILMGAALSIPLWIGIAIAASVLLRPEPIAEPETAALLAAAAVELVVLQIVWRMAQPTTARRLPPARPAARPPLLKQAALLAGLVLAYLHYYFWDVQLQIAALQSVTVFVPARALG